MNTQALLEKISQQDFDATSGEDMVRLACAYWHEGFVPDANKISQMSNEAQRKAGYLTEFFAAFNCVKTPNRNNLLKAAEYIKNSAKPFSNTENPDNFAAKWGISDNVNAFLRDILFYQTRHYIHDTPTKD